jgi:hypothetical protein
MATMHIRIQDGTVSEEYGGWDLSENIHHEIWLCPECGDTLFTDEKEAIKFLSKIAYPNSDLEVKG